MAGVIGLARMMTCFKGHKPALVQADQNCLEVTVGAHACWNHQLKKVLGTLVAEKPS